MLTTPTCSPLGPTSRTSGTRIRSLVRGSLMRFSSDQAMLAATLPSDDVTAKEDFPRTNALCEFLASWYRTLSTLALAARWRSATTR